MALWIRQARVRLEDGHVFERKWVGPYNDDRLNDLIDFIRAVTYPPFNQTAIFYEGKHGGRYLIALAQGGILEPSIQEIHAALLRLQGMKGI